MSVNLHSSALDSNGRSIDGQFVQNWKKITAVADKHGHVALSDETVTAVARVLEDVVQSNGEPVFTYVCEGGEYSQGSYVGSFAPSLLGEETFRAVRTALEEDANGAVAVATFDLVNELELRLYTSGTDLTSARLSVENTPAETVDINTSQGMMIAIFERLGLGEYTGKDEGVSGDVPLDVFEKAVNDNGDLTGMSERLSRFIAAAKKTGSTHVYWG